MLASPRIGAIHSVVFGGFAAHSLASRIDDARPRLIVSSDGGMRAARRALQALLDEAIALAESKPEKVLLVRRGSTGREDRRRPRRRLGRAAGQAPRRQCAGRLAGVERAVVHLYTSGTTGKPKGVQRDTGGYAVALAASMKHIYCGNAGETMFTTSDIGWVVGHSYIIYGPLIAGMTTIMYEGTPIRPDAGIWWKIVQDYKATVMFSARPRSAC